MDFCSFDFDNGIKQLHIKILCKNCGSLMLPLNADEFVFCDWSLFCDVALSVLLQSSN